MHFYIAKRCSDCDCTNAHVRHVPAWRALSAPCGSKHTICAGAMRLLGAAPNTSGAAFKAAADGGACLLPSELITFLYRKRLAGCPTVTKAVHATRQ
jgi:hypothetical protein